MGLTAKQMYDKLNAVDVIDVVGRAMTEQKDKLVALMNEQQKTEHVTGNEQPFHPYTEAYRRRKMRMGKSGQVDYELTGEMHAEMTLTVENGQYGFDSPATTKEGEKKSFYLKKRDGDKAFTLTPENNSKILPAIHDSVVNKIDRALS